MSASSTSEIPVLVVGGGPVGLLTSILLARHGLASLVVERREGPHLAPQAHVIGPRSLEICRAAGIDVGEIYARATPVSDGAGVLWMTTLAGQEIGRLSFENQVPTLLGATPTPFANLSQNLLEPILIDELRRESAAEVRFEHEWIAATQDADGVTSRIRGPDGEYEVRSRYVIAADGAGSRVRRSLGIDMVGPEQLASFAMIHFEGNLRPVVSERPGILYWIMDPDCRGTFIAHDIDRTWVYMYPHEADEPVDAFTHERCRELVRRAIGSDAVDFELQTISFWTMTAQIASAYGEGRIFLAGDSAHRFPPTGGIGMNTGIQDAHNLAWKLQAVEKGWADPALLASYERERRPVAQTNSDQSLKNALKMVEVVQALEQSDDLEKSRARMAEILASESGRARVAAAIEAQQDHFNMLDLHVGFSYEDGAVIPDGTAPPDREGVSDYVPNTRPGARVPHVWLEREGAQVSSLDLLAPDRFTVVTGPKGAAWAEAAAAVTGAPVGCVAIGDAIRDPHGRWAAVCEIEPDGALLVRPDQHVAWRSRGAVPDPAAALQSALAQVLGKA